MTSQLKGSAPPPSVVDGVDIDAVAAAVAGCSGVAALDGGPFGEVVSYLPGRKVDGVLVSGGRVTVQVRIRWGIPVTDLAALITVVVAPLTGRLPVDVVVADIGDPPASSPPDGPSAVGARLPSPGLPPV
jgi:hypothetical protein